MTVRLRGAKFQADFMVDGARFRETFPSLAEATAWEHEAKAAIALGKPVPSPLEGRSLVVGGDTIGDFVEHVHKVRWSSCKAGNTMLTNARLYATWIGPKTSLETAFSTAKMHEYMEHLATVRGVGGSTINRHLSSISAAAKVARSLRKITEIPEMPWQREGQGRIRWYSEYEMKALVNAVTLWGLPDYAHLFTFLAETGARLGEAERLLWEDVTLKGRPSVSFWETKNGESRTVPLTSPATKALQALQEAHCALRGPFMWLDRGNLRRTWERLRGHLEWMDDQTVVHTFRHTCASRLVQAGVDLMRVKTWMGHKTLATTMRYAHLAPKHLDDALMALEARRTG